MESREDRIIVVCACSNNYAPFCGAMITSLFYNNQDNVVEINILSSYIDENNRAKFATLATNYGQTINIINVNQRDFSTLPIGKRFPNISYEAYYRLAIPSLFQKYDKVLYLDCDIIVRHNLRELWETNIENFAIAGIKDTDYMVVQSMDRLGLPQGDSYYNSGVGLYNISFLREFEFEKKVWDFVANHYDKILYHDQDIVNAVCHGLFQSISVRWNMLDTFLMETPHIVDENRADLERWIENPCIIHFSAKYKPWHMECHHQYIQEFWKYVNISPWSGLKPVRRYKGFAGILVQIKFLGKRMFAFLGYKRFQYRKLTLKA